MAVTRIPRTNAEIIDAFGNRRFGELCGFLKFPVQRASDMRRRNKIASAHWKPIADAAKAEGLPITIETLERAQRVGSPPSANLPATAPTRESKRAGGSRL